MSQSYSSVTRSASRVFALLALTAALVVGHATNATTSLMVGLANTVIGIGGRLDPTSANVPAKLDGTVVPPGYTYDPIQYPATIQLSKSTAVSAPLVYQAVTTMSGQQLIVAGYSEGTLGAEAAKRQLLNNNTGPAPSDLSFVMIASPFAGNGGIFERFPGISVPFIVNNMGPARASAYNTTYVVNEYDPYADFPAYFNPLALANSLAGVWYAHPDVYYNAIDPGTTPAITKVVTNSAGGTDTYIFVPNNDLPLLAPVRAGAAAIGLTPLVKPVLDAVEPLLRVMIDMAYTDRTNANPAALRPFSLFTPLPRIISALQAIPGAINQGINNFVNDVRTELSPVAAAKTPVAQKAPVAAAATPATPPTKKPAPQPKRQTIASTPTLDRSSTSPTEGTGQTPKDQSKSDNRPKKSRDSNHHSRTTGKEAA
ncbi:hypothetical protein ABIA30_002438 [Mycobacterium sp. MAA66]